MAKGEVKITFKVFNEEFKSRMQEMKESTTRLNREFRLQKEQMKLSGSESDKLKAQIGYLNDRYKQAQDRVKMTDEQLEKAKKTFGENSEEVKRLEGELILAKTAEQKFDNQLKETNQQLVEAESKTLKASESLKKLGDGMQDAGKKIADTGKKMTLGVTTPIIGMGTAAVKSSIDFESAFAGTRKTIEMTEGEFAALEKGIRNMAKELPASATAIAGVAEQAGQLGIENENILAFSRIMIDMGEATNLSADVAATSLARFANITKMSQEDFGRLGSVIVELGNNLETTEAEIVSMGMNIAGAGKQIGMSEADIMSIAGSLSSVGLEAAGGGTAISRLMIDMKLATETGNARLKDFAGVAGMTGEEFQKAFKDDAAGALAEFISGLATAEDRGVSAIKVLDDMGITETRLRDTLLRASNASDVFNGSIELGTKAWDENTALTKEAEQRYETTASKIEIMKNKFKDFGIELGNKLMPILDRGLDMLQGWTDKFNNLSPAQMDSIIKFAGIAAAIGPLLLVGGKLITGIGGIISLFGTVSGAIGVVTTGAVAATPAIGGLATAFTVLTGPVGLIIAGVAALTVGTIALVNHLKKDSIPAVELFGDGVSSATEKAVGGFLDLNEKATLSLKELSWSGKEVTAEMADGIVGNFSQMSEQVLSKLDEQHTESLGKMQEFLANSEGLSKEEQEATLANMQEGYEQKKLTIEEGEARVAEIMEKASADKRGLTKAEQEEINTIQTEMVETGIQVLSENEVESKLIMERMKEQAGQMSALQAAEVVRNSLEQKDGAIKAAEDQYDEVMKEIIRQRDEAGTISAEQADKLIKEAQRQRDETVQSANKMHLDVIAEAKAQSKEHVDEVDWETGEIKSRWDILKEKTGETFKKMGEDISSDWDAMKKTTSDFWESTKKSAGDKMQEIKDKIANSKLAEAWDAVWNFKLPKIKLPKFEMTGSFSLAPPSIPKVSVTWQSEGAIFRRPTILNGIGVGDAYKGVGRGAEAVLPISKLTGMIREALPNAGGSSKTEIHQHITINSPKELSPSEIARASKRTLQELAMNY